MKIFISYRRADSAGTTGRLDEHLRKEFGAEEVYIDVDNIPPGADFAEHIQHMLLDCDVLLAVIGQRWLNRSFNRKQDYVQLELEAALTRNMLVVPVLVDGAELPKAKHLPANLRRLLKFNAIRLDNGRDFTKHFERLAEGIRTLRQAREAKERRALEEKSRLAEEARVREEASPQADEQRREPETARAQALTSSAPRESLTAQVASARSAAKEEGGTKSRRRSTIMVVGAAAMIATVAIPLLLSPRSSTGTVMVEPTTSAPKIAASPGAVGGAPSVSTTPAPAQTQEAPTASVPTTKVKALQLKSPATPKVVTSLSSPPLDCSGVCKSFGLCSNVEEECKAATRADCAGSDVCKSNGRCTPLGGACKVRFDADCAKTPGCLKYGNCKALTDRCGAESLAACFGGSACRRYNDCGFKDSICSPKSNFVSTDVLQLGAPSSPGPGAADNPY